MFGLTMRERLQDVYKNACIKEIGEYKREVLGIVQSFVNGVITNEEFEKRGREVLYNYIERVQAIIEGVVEGAPGVISTRYRLALVSPHLAGAPSYSEYSIPMISRNYLITYYAFTGKAGKPKDALAVKNMMKYYINKVALELEKEHPELS